MFRHHRQHLANLTNEELRAMSGEDALAEVAKRPRQTKTYPAAGGQTSSYTRHDGVYIEGVDYHRPPEKKVQ